MKNSVSPFKKITICLLTPVMVLSLFSTVSLNTHAEEINLSETVVKHVHRGASGQTYKSGCFTQPYSSYEAVGEGEDYELEVCVPKDEGGYACWWERHTRYDYGYVTRYTCSHGNEEYGVLAIRKSNVQDFDYTAEFVSKNSTDYFSQGVTYTWYVNGIEKCKTKDIKISSVGTYKVVATYKDIYSGQTESVSCSYEVTYQVKAGISESNWTNKPVIITSTAIGDETHDFTLYKEQGDLIQWDSNESGQFIVEKEGTHTWKVRAKSISGIESTSNSVTTKYDCTPPTIKDIVADGKIPKKKSLITIKAEDIKEALK